MHVEWRAAVPFGQQDHRLLEQSVPGRRAVGHFRASAGADVQAVRTDTRRVAGQREASLTAERLRLCDFRVGKER